MNSNKNTFEIGQQEINLKSLFNKIYKYKRYILLSIFSCIVIALIYIKSATPIYEVSTSVLIDPSGSNRVLGGSQYVEGGVSLIEMEKNLYNEIGIIKSYGLIEQTVEDLNYDISYYGSSWGREKEHYGYYPFEVIINRAETQLFDVPFEIELISDNKYKIFIEADDFMVSNVVNKSTREILKPFEYSGEFQFGEPVKHKYFNFTINKTDYIIEEDDFKDINLSFQIHQLDNITKGYLSNLEVNNIDIQASIFKIISNGPIVAKEVAFLDKLTENYIQNKLVSRNNIASSKEAFIRNQLNVITDSLVIAESQLETFKKDKSAINLSRTGTNALGQTSNLQARRSKIELDIKYYESLITLLQDNINNDDFIIPNNIGIDNTLINENMVELTKLYAERANKKFFVTSNNQEMSILNQRIKDAKGQLINNLQSAIRSSQLVLQNVRGQLSSVDGIINTLPTSEKQLLSIERQSNLYENLYNYLSQELAKTGIARAESTSDTRVLDEARMVGDAPVSPQKTLLLAFAFIVGTIIPVTWILMFSDKNIIETSDQIRAHSKIPLIASISRYVSNPENPNFDISLWNVKESFRDLTAKLKFIGPTEDCCVIGITSNMPEEGKTFCAINLGISFAEMGKKTLIIDTDLRNPSLITEFNKIEGKGLSNYLGGEIDKLEEIIYTHEELKNLQFIPTSVVDGNIHGLLSDNRMEVLIANLKEKYDYIILDTPAVGLVSDFILFRDEIDINIFVVRRQIAKISFLEDFEKLISPEKPQKSFIVFNDTLEKDFKYGYGQKYGVNTEPQRVNEKFSL